MDRVRRCFAHTIPVGENQGVAISPGAGPFVAESPGFYECISLAHRRVIWNGHIAIESGLIHTR